MLRILQISITLIFVIICTTTAQTTEETTEAPLAPRCEGDICYCIKGTHEAFFKGRKYCAPDSLEPCTEHAIRISNEVCECKKGYHFLNDDRTMCVPDHMEETTSTISEYSPHTSTEPCPEHAIRLSSKVCECKNGYHFLNDDRTVCVPDHMEETTTTKITTTTTIITTSEHSPHDSETTPTNTTTTQTPTNMTTTQTPNITTTTSTTTSTQPKPSDESEILYTHYIYVGIAVLIITALILIVLLCLLLKR